MTDGRTKVAVLGGGVGSITTAFELTATEELRNRFDVTVYQLGWRIGGKGASGRNLAKGGRIEEHGLHVWFGFYDNAFKLMREAYRELGREPGTPLATLEDAFKGCDQIVLYDKIGEEWRGYAFNAPRNHQRPGMTGQLPSFWEMASRACGWAVTRYRELMGERPELVLEKPPARFTPAWFWDLAGDLAVDIGRLELAGAEHLLHLADRLTSVRERHTDLSRADQAAHHWFLVRLLTGFRDWLWTHVVEERADHDADLRLFFTIFDTIATTTAGIVRDGVLEHGFDAINDEEWSAWLSRHGAKELTIGRTPAERAPVLRSVYDVAFGYLDGDIEQANVAAGTATNDLLRLLFTYRGSLMYKMQAGMGDTVFTPFYEVLKRRGVKFRFFNAVTGLHLSDDGKLVDRIEVVPQVELANGEYDPLVPVKDLPCWPSEPLWEQLADGERLREAGVDFEAEANPLGRDPFTLKRGEDFDEVVLGISVAALPPICGELIEASEPFRKMIETSATVQTQAFQLWLTEEAGTLGWEHSLDSVAGCYVEPLDTYCEMSHLLAREDWGEDDGVRSVGYFCGVLDERRGESPDEATARARANAIEFLGRDAETIWPSAVAEGAIPAALRWELLADPNGAAGPERFDSQFWRANTALTERYVLTPAGSVEHRLPSDQSGFDNVVLAGDWTKNGIDGGCVEAAATSGMQAARGLIGHQRPIIGEDPRWLRPSVKTLPRYAEFGGRATSPSPFRSTGGKLRGFLLDGDEEKIAALVQRTLTEPARGAVEYRPLSGKVLLMVGGFDSITSMAPPFDRWGSIREVQASFFVPVLAGRDHGPVFIADRLCFAVPYILVDNPMSYLGGREDYGFAKTMGRFEPEDGLGERVTIEAYGGNFSPDNRAGWRPFVEIAAASAESGEQRDVPEGPAGLVELLGGGAIDRHDDGDIVLPGLRLARQLVEDMARGRGTQVFLKQFRDSAQGTSACYQSVVEADLQVTRVVPRPSLRDWDVTIHSLDSHPVGRELGVGSQTASMCLDLEMDFVIEQGREIRPQASPAAEQVMLPADPPSGGAGSNGARPAAVVNGAQGLPGLAEELFDLVEGVAGRLRRELSGLRRLRPW